MVTAIIFTVAIAMAGWMTYRVQGPVVIDELLEVVSIIAIILTGLMLMFAFILPDFAGVHIPKWQMKMFFLIPWVCLYVTIFPSAVEQKIELVMPVRTLRRIATVVLVLFLCLAIYFRK